MTLLVALSGNLQGVGIGVADRAERAERVEVPHEISPPVAGADHGHAGVGVRLTVLIAVNILS